jgi:DNA-directed RNA polymerase subunit L
MEVKVLEESKTKMVFELAGSDHTLCNAIKKELHADDKVKAASYTIRHPSIGIPQMVVETSGKSPRDALMDAARRLQKACEKFKQAAEKELK